MNTEQKPTETGWLKDVKNETICQWFYAMFFVVAILGAIAVLMQVYTYARFYPRVPFAPLLTSIVTLALGTTNTLFLYIMCSRSLLK